MPAPESILLKVKLLLNLANSPNQNEADNARAMVEKLVAKYSITEEELKSIEDKKPLYGEENLLFSTMGIVGWRQQLALAIGKHFYCQIVQEELVPASGPHEFRYYIYGDPEDESVVKFVFGAYSKKVEELVANKCRGRGQIYVSSYCEGVVEAIKNNIYWEGIDIPDVKKPTRPMVEEQKQLSNGEANITKHKEEKEKPVQETVDVNSQSMIKDIAAYFKGLDDGKYLALSDLLELEAHEEARRLATGAPQAEEPDNL